jgi:hypothetical protein
VWLIRSRQVAERLARDYPNQAWRVSSQSSTASLEHDL